MRSLSIIFWCFFYFIGVGAYQSSDVENANILAQKWIIQNWEIQPQNYKLDSQLTRREMIKIMILISNKDIKNSCTGIFQDMTNTDWGCKYAETAVSHWYIASNTLFRPNDSVTQIEALKMIMQVQTIESEVSNDWREWYVLKARNLGLIWEEYFKYDTIASRKKIFEVSVNSYLTEKEIIQMQQTVQYKEIFGIDANLLSLDIYYSSNIEEKKPVVVYVHWGGWAQWDKQNKLENKIKLFESLWYVLISVNYRLSPNSYSEDEERIKYPIHNEDVASAIAWTLWNIWDYWWESDKIALLGHSAGAHIVSLIGTDETFLQQEGLSFNAISGIASIDSDGYDVIEKVLEEDDNIYKNAFGIHESDLRAASPLHNISPWNNYPDFFIWKRGSKNRQENADTFITALEEVWVSVDIVDGSIYSHEGINDAIGDSEDITITPSLVDFFKNIFK